MEENTASSPFFEKEYSCPLCSHVFYKEQLNTSLIKALEETETIELRQIYSAHKTIGTIIPIVYSLIVCPNCYYSTFEDDLNPTDDNIKNLLIKDEVNRKELVNSLFRKINFKRKRNIEEAFLSYLLAIQSYSLIEENNVLYTFKKALCTLRASWITQDILTFYKENIFSIIYSILFSKAAKYYGEAFTYFQNSKTNINKEDFGPDENKNWGYEGFLYITGYLNYKLSTYDKDENRKIKTLNNIIKIMTKILESDITDKVLINKSRAIYNDARSRLQKG